VFESNEADVLREMDAFIAGLKLNAAGEILKIPKAVSQ
jgi:hypothetical protein